MTPERWQEVKNEPYATLDLNREEWPAYLDRAYAADHSQRQEVHHLPDLAEDIRSSFLRSPLAAGLEAQRGGADEDIARCLPDHSTLTVASGFDGTPRERQLAAIACWKRSAKAGWARRGWRSKKCRYRARWS